MGCCDTPLLSHLTPWHVHDHHHRHHHHHHHLTQGWHVHDHHHQPWCVIFVKALVYLGSLPLKVCFSCKVQLASVEPTFVQKQKQQRRKISKICLFLHLILFRSFFIFYIYYVMAFGCLLQAACLYFCLSLYLYLCSSVLATVFRQMPAVGDVRRHFTRSSSPNLWKTNHNKHSEGSTMDFGN